MKQDTGIEMPHAAVEPRLQTGADSSPLLGCKGYTDVLQSEQPGDLRELPCWHGSAATDWHVDMHTGTHVHPQVMPLQQHQG